MINTARLLLRPWRVEDRAAWTAMMSDPEVSVWLGGAATAAQVDAAFDRLRAAVDAEGFGLWAAERKSDRTLLGSIGVRRIPEEWAHPMSGETELGWRLARHAWGEGYASEGAAACLAWSFAHLDSERIVAFTARTNARSEAVMARIGMKRDTQRDFDHPALAQNHPLRRHIVYCATRPAT